MRGFLRGGVGERVVLVVSLFVGGGVDGYGGFSLV